VCSGNNGEELTAEHIAWNMRRWLEPSLGSRTWVFRPSPRWSKFVRVDEKGEPKKVPVENGIEVIDTHTLRLNLANPVLSVAEDCSEKTTLIVHPSFVAPFSDRSNRYGPYTLAELEVSDRCVLKRITRRRWQGSRLWGGEVYLDEYISTTSPPKTSRLHLHPVRSMSWLN
jgi:peptide/nickel transport system substrate-binding protein